MSDELDLETLGQEWRRIDMKTIEMALATGKLRGEYTWGFAVNDRDRPVPGRRSVPARLPDVDALGTRGWRA